MRILLFVLALISVFVMPPWVFVILVSISALRYRAWEMLFLALMIDFAWLPEVSLLHSVPLFTLVALLLVWGLDPLRKEVL
jgi:hypothetical protein